MNTKECKDLTEVRALARELRQQLGIRQTDLPNSRGISVLENKPSKNIRVEELQEYLTSLGLSIRIQLRPSSNSPIAAQQPVV